ncbi:phosphate signaling complex PhoU family protein [Candidatus Protofrankia californiensis]|uniref:phosphate signaling complex PhoU family protein n=1 Tax=Candidatus Protofrankia californiensis TaxID=1839754 RepID=UPI001041BC56|nr:PhoU domain-containing protein [Candidatus Protofrankia californiensis]
MDVPGPRRWEYTAALRRLRIMLGELAEQTSQIVLDATTAVTGQADTAGVHTAVACLRGCCQNLDEDLVMLLARQNPVAGDLHLVVAGLRTATAVQRMAELADHIAATADRRAPAVVVPVGLRPTLTRLGRLCAEQASCLATAICADDPALAARQVTAGDDPIDRIHRQLMAILTDPGWPHGIQRAVDLALLSRYYERYADQAVTAARHLARLRWVPPLSDDPDYSDDLNNPDDQDNLDDQASTHTLSGARSKI